jgi:hypothetical protein
MAKERKLWISTSAKKMEEKGTKGALHEDLGIAKDKKIPRKILVKAAKSKGKTGQRARWALNVKKATG